MLISRPLVASIALVTSMLIAGILGTSADTIEISPPKLRQGIRHYIGSTSEMVFEDP